MKCPIRVFSVGVVLACALAGCAQSPVGSESSAPSSAPEAPVSSEAVSSEAVSSEIPSSDTPAPSASQKPAPPASIPEVKQNPETGDSLGNPNPVPPPSWDQPGADAEKEALALAQEYLLTLPSRDSNVESVAIEETSLSWDLETALGPTVQITFKTTVVGSADSTSLSYPAGESHPWIHEDYRLLPSGWEFLGEGITYPPNPDAPNPWT